MKTEKKILVAFVLNLAFSVFEFFGGVFTGSVAILSDAVHDIADAVGIGISYLLERKSKRPPDEKYTYGYARYSVLGGLIVTMLLIFGSVVVIYHAICRLIEPRQLHYNGMIVYAIVGVCINGGAAFFTHGGESINQKAVNLHMLEDVLGWMLVLGGAVVMRFTDWGVLDPILSVCVAGFILFRAAKNIKKTMGIFLEKVPDGVEIGQIKAHILNVEGVLDVHHIHIWSLDGESNLATMHIVTKNETITPILKQTLEACGIRHTTFELETVACEQTQCNIKCKHHCGHHH